MKGDNENGIRKGNLIKRPEKDRRDRREGKGWKEEQTEG